LEHGEADAVLSKAGPNLLHPADLIEKERQLKRALEELVIARALEVTTARESKAAAEAANVAKSDFLSSMSHELRSPLNAILGFAQLLETAKPPPTDTQTKQIHQILKAGWYLLDLVSEILDLAAVESNKLSLSQEAVLLTDVMRECQTMVESQAKNCSIRLHFFAFDSTWFVNADRTRLIQVLMNLLTNAIKYNCEQGTVEVNCTERVQGRIRISVKDSGMGLPHEKLLQLFQPFNRLGQEVGPKQGTGLGLVVAKRLVELMGGCIGVESTVGVGSEFWFELPRVVATQVPAENTISYGITPQTQSDTAQRTLLYVEDDQANLMLVDQILEDRLNVRMLGARDANLGIALARAHLPEVILMDINLPGITGFDALTILQKDPLTAQIPIIALSAKAMRGDIDKGMEAGFFRYLTKPFKINEFLTVLNDALEFAKAESRPY
jgi:signal transduction histidine kinase/ActR/RegA family two-component response regulator